MPTDTKKQQCDPERPDNFLQSLIKQELQQGKIDRVITRFPPEPNGYLHLGHAKAICLNFGLAEEFQGQCYLRFDDTNPSKENILFVNSIKEDISWLGFKWSGKVRFASDYFDQFYDWALYLIDQELAYVCQLNPDEARKYKGTLKTPGINSPYRNQSVSENLSLFKKMRAGELDEGQAVLRAKIDMSHPNMNMRDPILYRVLKQPHYRTGNNWNIYPSYDFAHGQEDAIEQITHSICTLEFADHRPLYDWFIEQLPVPHKPRQFEFARLRMNYTMTSKRKLKKLVASGLIDGWDDPRLYTIAGMRRRGFRPQAIRKFCTMIGVARAESVVDISMLEHVVRDDLDKNAPRAMCVLNPLKLILTNYDADKIDYLMAAGHPSREGFPQRQLPFTSELYIEASDYRQQANKKYKRLVKGKRIRLRNAFVIEADESLLDAAGNIVAIKARIIENTLGREPEDGIKPRGVIHWVSATINTPCSVVLYQNLFKHPHPDTTEDELSDLINPESKRELTGCYAEIGLQDAPLNHPYQFERLGYFCRDSKQHKSLVFNRTIELRDIWNKQ